MLSCFSDKQNTTFAKQIMCLFSIFMFLGIWLNANLLRSCQCFYLYTNKSKAREMYSVCCMASFYFLTHKLLFLLLFTENVKLLRKVTLPLAMKLLVSA